MLNQLRIRFVFNNILLISIVLIMGLFLSITTSFHYQKRKTMDVMKEVLANVETSAEQAYEGQVYESSTDSSAPDYTVLIIVVTTDKKGNIKTVSSDSGIPLDKHMLKNAAGYSAETEEESGLVPGYALRYIRQPMKGGYKIALADRTHEFSNLNFVVWLHIVLGFCAFLLLLAVSEFMAKKAIEPVGRAIENQKRFTADASHELKTPLTVIMADLDILESKPDADSAERHKWIESAKSEANRMTKLVNGMLFLARSDSEQGEHYAFKNLDFSFLVEDCVLAVEALAFEHHALLESNIEDDIEICADEGRIKQCVMVLLENALKYVDEGGKIEVQLYSREREVVLNIINTGNPIPDSKKPHIFERFFRADSARGTSGYGLGLSIAENIIRAHNGYISLAYSTKEKGTCFTIMLPTTMSARTPGNTI